MEGLREFLGDLKRRGHARDHFLGLLNILIGRRIGKKDGSVLGTGATWREAAAALKKVRWDRDAVKEIGLDPLALPPRDRARYWYLAIAQAQVDSDKAMAAGDRLAELLKSAGYVIGMPPSNTSPEQRMSEK
jgi:hypothetical protein